MISLKREEIKTQLCACLKLTVPKKEKKMHTENEMVLEYIYNMTMCYGYKGGKEKESERERDMQSEEIEL